MNNPWGLTESEARVMTALAEYGWVVKVGESLNRSPVYLNNLITKITTQMYCATRIQAVVKWDRWYQSHVFDQKMHQVDVNLAHRLQQATRGEHEAAA